MTDAQEGYYQPGPVALLFWPFYGPGSDRFYWMRCRPAGAVLKIGDAADRLGVPPARGAG